MAAERLNSTYRAIVWEELAFKEEGVKVTMTLGKSSVEFFKKAAQKYHTPYQKMIRKLVDAYATRHPLP